MGDIMTSGTSTSFKSGSGIAIIISKNAIEEQGIEPGHVIEYDVRRCNIEKRGATRGKNFQSKKETKEETAPSETTPEQPEGSI